MFWTKETDDFLIDRVFQRFARWTHLNFGIDSVEWSRICVMTEFSSILVMVGWYFALPPFRGMTVSFNLAAGIMLVYLAIFLILRCFSRFLKVRLLEAWVLRPRDERERNPYRLKFRIYRRNVSISAILAGSIFCLLPHPVLFALAANCLLAMMGEYFIASEPLPPAKSRLRKWLESWRKVHIPVPSH